MAHRWEERLSAIDSAVKEGRSQEARHLLSVIARERPPRLLWGRAASLARRAGLPLLSLRLLNPAVRPTRGSPATATPQETAEYAASLTRAGAVDEALALLRTLRAEDVVEARFYEALAQFTRWNYEAASGLLRDYVMDPRISSYARLVGRVNLAAALVTERRLDEASAVLEELRLETESGGFRLLHGNCLELSAQASIFSKRWKDADRFLTEARDRLAGTDSLDLLFVDKWIAVAELLRRGPNPARRGALSAVRREAARRRHWETIRDCDRFLAVATGDRKRFAHVYFGTPFAAFRARLLVDFPGDARLPDRYRWHLGPPGKIRGEFDPRAGSFEPGGRLKPGQILHRLLLALSEDFYRPLRAAALFARLHPTEHYNPTASPLRVHQALLRFRRWCAYRRVPLAVVESGAEYRLDSRRAFGVRIDRSLDESGPLVAARGSLPETFAARDLEELAAVSRNTALRWLREGMRRGSLEALGGGRSRKYRFV